MPYPPGSGGELPDQLPLIRVPQAHDVAVVTGGQQFAVRGEGDSMHPAVDPAELLLAGHVPKADGCVEAGGDERLAVQRERQRVDAMLVSLEDTDLLGRADVPQPDRVVASAVQSSPRSEQLPIRREGYRA